MSKRGEYKGELKGKGRHIRLSGEMWHLFTICLREPMEHNNMITNAGRKTTQSLTDIYLVEMTILLMILTSGII